jgi:type IV pilus assembly protein PilM
MVLAQMLGLEPVLIEPTITSCARFFSKDKHSDIPSIIVDFGSLTADMSIFSNTKANLANSTVPTGGLVFTKAIQNKLDVSTDKAQFIKTKHGLGVSEFQKQITTALEPELQKIVTEIRRMIRYYGERYGADKHIGQVVMLGGGANMPGLGDYLTNALKVPVRTYNNPWGLFEHAGLHEPLQADRLMFATVAGLSLADPKEVLSR